MDKPTFRGPPYKGEINPKTGRPYATNPRSYGARVKAWARKPAGEGYGTKTQGEVWKEWNESKKPKIHPDDIAPEVGHQQEVDKQQAIQDADMKEGAYLKDPEEEEDNEPENAPSSFRNALTIANAARKGRQLLSIGTKVVKTVPKALALARALTIREF